MTDFVNPGTVTMALALVSVIFYLTLTDRLPRREDNSMKRLADLEATIKVLQADHVRDANLIEELRRHLAAAEERIRFLEAQVNPPKHIEKFPLPELLVVFGPDTEIVEADQLALRKARIDFDQLYEATLDQVEEELQSRRENGRPIRWLHISAHGRDSKGGKPAGIELADGKGGLVLADPAFWSGCLEGVEVVMLATCEGTDVARDLVGIVDTVVFFRQEVNSERAAVFSGLFWGGVTCGMSVDTAYGMARNKVPEVKNFVTLRARRK